MQPPPATTDLVLAGGGHAHLHVLKAFAQRPVRGVRVMMVSRELQTPYSGMLPGHIAGIYRREDVHIDLVRLAAATGARLIHGEAIGLDRANHLLLLKDQPPLAYHLLSIDVGIRPSLAGIEGADRHAIAVKPIGQFLEKLDALLAQMRSADGPVRVAVVGGGAGGVELILSLRARLLQIRGAQGISPDRLSMILVTRGTLLASHNARVREAFRRILSERGICLLEGRAVSAVEAGLLRLADGETIEADAVLLATGAAPPDWFARTGLDLDAGGFLKLHRTLQTSDPAIFAAGDCAAIAGHERPKAGVYAVRAGPPLARNLRRALLGKKPHPWRPQKQNLALISTGERYAIASRGWFKAEGAWLWTMKDWIDRRWIRMVQNPHAAHPRRNFPSTAGD